MFGKECNWLKLMDLRKATNLMDLQDRNNLTEPRLKVMSLHKFLILDNEKKELLSRQRSIFSYIFPEPWSGLHCFASIQHNKRSIDNSPSCKRNMKQLFTLLYWHMLSWVGERIFFHVAFSLSFLFVDVAIQLRCLK